MCAGPDVFIWRPFDGSDGTITQHFKLPSNEWRSFASISEVKWVEGGRKLVLESLEGTILIWDSQSNSKELFKRTSGALIASTGHGFYYVAGRGQNGKNCYLSVDGDGKVRYWDIDSEKS